MGVALVLASLALGVVAVDRRYWSTPVVVPEMASDRRPGSAVAPYCGACQRARPWKQAAIASGATGVLLLLGSFACRRKGGGLSEVERT